MVVTSSTTTTTTTATATNDEDLGLKDYWRSKLPNTRMPKAIQADLLTKSKKAVVVTGNVELVLDNMVNVDLSWDVATDTNQLRGYDPTETLFFLENELHPGSTMNLDFTKTAPLGINFLPRKEAESIPFSSKKFSNVLQRFSVLPGSNNAKVMKNTIRVCEMPADIGEEKYCATSLESMIDFSCSKLGTNNVQVLSTEVQYNNKKKEEEEEERETSTSQKKKMIKEYSITGDVEKIGNHEAIVCHGLPYMYAVFYCHARRDTRVYKVPLVATDGTKAKAIAVCHIDTSKMNPKHLAFQQLKVKPGTIPICHALLQDQVAWVPNM
ncbi:BURP domain-containing protein 3-like [Telopea speciosissima]|uniref:BURP domain-containing protein 3-like n=1 Tax=Telopea speciosissima TaxID=54955 RepID=UPI001CC3826F|nr:BURP domain-containing protein 3-like [Telopea speciosissima]